MAKIDLEKFICSLIAKSKGATYALINDALQDQGYEYKDGQIVEMAQKAEEIKDYTSIDPHFGKTIDGQILANSAKNCDFEPANKEIVNDNLCDNKFRKMLENKPKFKAGDWIVNKEENAIAQVKEVKKDFYGTERYYIEFLNGVTSDPMPCFVDYKFRLWNIQDAKDGDVLVDAYGNIGIFKEHDNSYWTSFCSLGKNGGFRNFETLHEVEKVCPATKEQCEKLMKAMAEAGYEFDFTTKELKNIEQSTEGIEIPFGAADSELQEAIYDIPQGFHAEIDGDMVIIKKGEQPTEENSGKDGGISPNSEWSEEDKDILHNVIKDIERLYGEATVGLSANVLKQELDWLKSLRPQKQHEWDKEDESGLADALWAVKQAAKSSKDENEMGTCWYAENWLKSLKDRMLPQPKQEWIEPDRIILEQIHSFITAGEAHASRETIKEWGDWLNSLKNKVVNQKQWEPTDEQLDCLLMAAGSMSDTERGNEIETVLRELHNELKKLKGE